MRWLCVLVMASMIGACGAPNRPVVPSELGVEDTALWFMRAALAGDQATARTLTLPWFELAQLSTRATTEPEWDATVNDVLARLSREAGEGSLDAVRAHVVSRRTLDPARDRKVTRTVEVAIVRFDFRTPDGARQSSPLAWLFVKTPSGWKFSPKQ